MLLCFSLGNYNEAPLDEALTEKLVNDLADWMDQEVVRRAIRRLSASN